MKEVLLRVTNVRKSLGATLALDDVSLEVRRGDIVGLVGANGAGKTTLIRIVMRLTAPDAGVVERAAGGPITAGYLPEERGLYRRQTVDATLGYLARLKGLSRSEAAADVTHWLDRVEMTAFRARAIERLSKGQQQKVQLAAACLADPELLVFDEPLSGLDPLNTRLVCDVVRAAADRGRGVLLSAHQLGVVDRICSHVVMLSHGRVAVAGSIETVRGGGTRTLEDVFAGHAAAGGER